MDEDAADTPTSEWQRTWDAIKEVLHARGTYDEWIDEDPEGRDPHELLTLLLQAGAQVDPNIIRLDDDRMFPFDVSAQALCKYLKWFCTAGPYKRSGKKGGMTSADGKYIFQFGKRSDGGLLDLLHEEMLRLNALNKQQLSPRDQGRRKLLKRFLRGFEEERAWLLESESMEVTDAHLVFYEKNGVMKVHLDTRLDSPVSMRALYPLRSNDGSDRNARRLSFYVGMRQDEDDRRPKLEVETAFCLGSCGGVVILTGQGCGGFPIIPRGEVFGVVRGRSVFVWHEPLNNRMPLTGMRGTFVFSGKKV